MKNLSVFIITLFSLCCNTQAQPKNPLHEMRGVWIATVTNIDWPSARNLTTDQQKQEFITILDMHRQNGMNAIFMQVRPAADAIYPSQYEPWSIFLTGTQGQPPVPYYDPLAFMIEETHKRNMEFHAWINPYRAVFKIKENPTSPSHITKLQPDWFVDYGEHRYFNPGIPEVRRHTLRVVRDLIDRYDIDGIHMDDYFYPYKIAGKEFPDEATYKQYGNGLSKDDWRRSNCDSIIKNLWETVNSMPRRVKFGISPFGVWKSSKQDPLGSNTTGGGNNYYELYADIRLWLQNGWMDYCVPQLYWEINHPTNRYDVLLDWWNKNTFERHLYIGHGIYRAGQKGWTDKNEIPNQISMLRKYTTTQGSIYFSSKTFNNNPMGWCDTLKRNYYSTLALPHTMPWIDNTKAVTPTIQKNNESYSIQSNAAHTKAIAIFYGNSNETASLYQLVQGKSATVTKSPNYAKTFVATVTNGNMVSELVELE
jgi:uncharacterized lipoprotein YddW (UPF0748 family)